MDKRFLNITKIAANKARIEIDGTIGGYDWDTWRRKNTGTDIRKQLKELDGMEVTEIEVLITSLGGYVDDALQIHDALKAHPAKVTTIVQGFCASAATIIACAGDVRIISPNALYLIHKCLSWVDGNENDLEAELEAQRTTNEVILNIYKGVLKKEEKDLLELFNANDGDGKWITAEEALAFGFATEIQEFEGDNKPVTNMARFLNQARNLMPLMQHNPTVEPNNPNNRQNQTTMKKLINLTLLCALLSLSAEAEFDEKQGFPLTEDKLQKLEDTLKEFENLKASSAKNQEDLKGAQDALSTAQNTIAEKDKLIATLTAERDDYKAKYEAKPADTPKTNGADANDVENDDLKAMYAELEKMY
jgi:ATP-dependent protease ClpP protease subunit